MSRTSLRRRGTGLAVACAAAVACIAPSPAAAVVGDCTPASSWGALRGPEAARVIDLTNEHRAQLGLSQLLVSPTLTRAAEWKSRHMATYNYLDHADPAPPVARTTGERLEACGYTAGWGENIGEGAPTPETMFNAWLNSAGHRANIENPAYRAIGVGVAVSSSGTLFWTQDFGTVADAGSTAGPPPPPQPAPPAPQTGAASSAPAPPAAPAGSPATSRPTVRFTSRKPRHRARVARFTWTTTGTVTSTTCRLDRHRPVACRSPLAFKVRRAGRHRLTVRVAGPAGHDRITVRWVVSKRRAQHR